MTYTQLPLTGEPISSFWPHRQDARKKGVQNKIIISQKAFIIQIYGLYHYKG
jgi:hypothetical protein